jgi:hypothetical protein
MMRPIAAATRMSLTPALPLLLCKEQWSENTGYALSASAF